MSVSQKSEPETSSLCGSPYVHRMSRHCYENSAFVLRGERWGTGKVKLGRRESPNEDALLYWPQIEVFGWWTPGHIWEVIWNISQNHLSRWERKEHLCIHFHTSRVLVFLDYHHKSPQNQKFILYQFWGLKSEVNLLARAVLHLKALGRHSSLLIPSF